MLAAGALCNDATLQAQPEGAAHWHAQGDPTEAAIVVAAARLGLLKHELDQLMPRVAEAPFDSDRKRMTTVHTLPEHGAPEGAPSSAEAAALQALAGSRYVAVTKGAADMLAEASSRVWEDGCLKAMDESWRKRIADAGNDLAANGMRVLGVAMRPLDEAPGPANVAALETDLVFLGMVGIVDPPRTEAKDAVATCRAAGIRPVMITGDHPLTARHIARELGITAGEAVTTGRDLATMSGADLQASTSVASVYARVSPEHKLSIVDALQAQGHIVAMTGDGVNDAPALKKADIGVAMGITGTDVSKEAADMVLLDDNFATIVAAVEEGRIIFDNTRKFVKYLMTTNASELALMLFGPLLGMPLPLLPLQILWINLVTDGLPGLALGVEPAERNVMKRGPYPPGESIFARGLGVHIVWVSLLMAAITLGVGYAYWRVSEPGSHLWQTMLFNTLALSQMAHVIAIRSSRDSLFRIGLLSNKPLLGAVILTLLGQMAVLYVPVLSGLLETNPLTLGQLALTFGLAAVVFVAVEIEKWWNRNHER
jgi:Ca2+-transporting ATPase